MTIYLRWYKNTGWCVRFHFGRDEVQEQHISQSEADILMYHGIPTL